MTAGEEVVSFRNLGREDVARVGGKNASLGEMVRALAPAGIRVPEGFATTAAVYWRFIEANGLKEPIAALLAAFKGGRASLQDTGSAIRKAILLGEWPPETAAAILAAYRDLSSTAGATDLDVAVRSSATAEDLPDASFAGQQETFLNISGETDLLSACRRCLASLFTDRAIAYRDAKGFDHMKVALSVGVQRMVRSDLGASGVMFTIDTETGFDRVVLIDAAFGLGETVVQGQVDPDQYQVFKPFLHDPTLVPIIAKRLGGKAVKMIYAAGAGRTTRTVPTSKAERGVFVLQDEEVLSLARWAIAIEGHYGGPMDIEWAKDGRTGELFVVQARPETVQSRRTPSVFRSVRLGDHGRTLAKGIAIGQGAVSGRVCIIERAEDIDRFVDGAILVTANTDPDWVPIMKRAAAIVADRGGRTSHAAIVSRELGLPAIVGAGNATEVLHDEQEITVSCAEGEEGFVYEGTAEIETEERPLADIPKTRTKVLLNLANPAAAMRWWQLPADGVGLTRIEFVVTNAVRIHPMALVHFDSLKDSAVREEIARITAGYTDKREYFVDALALGLSRIAAALHPRPVVIRMSDFKTNEYAELIGGRAFEPREENPMLGFRGASRYYSDAYRAGFSLECRAIRKLRDTLGFRNVIVMIPFCRTPAEADKVLAVMAENGLVRGRDGLEVLVMCEIPSNVVLAAEFAKRFDGFSIGSNDLTQLTLGVDRDSEQLAALFDEQDAAVRWMIEAVIRAAHAAGSRVGFCGEAPSNDPEFARFLVACGIDSISVSPSAFLAVKQHVAAAEAEAAIRSDA